MLRRPSVIRRAGSIALLVAALMLPAEAFAHGRPPFVGDLHFHPTDPNTVVARATWGFVITEDGGTTWRWICADVAGIDPTREDPAFAVMPDGAILVGSFSGLTRSTPSRCSFDYPDEDLRDVFVIDVLRDPATPTTAWAILTDGAGPDSVWRSQDSGESFDQVGADIEEILLERVRVAPSDGARVYLSGAIPITAAGGERQAFVLRSSDTAATFERTPIVLEDGERNVHLLAVDPTDPDRLLARVLRRATDSRPERLILSEDGGVTFAEVARLRLISDAAFTADGATVIATSESLDGIYRSTDGGRTFAALVGGNLKCAETREGELWICADELKDGWSLGRSVDDGDVVETVLQFSQVHTLVECPVCSQVGYVCPEWFPDLAFDLRLDAGVTTSFDGGVTGAARDALPPEVCEAGVPPRPDAGPPAGMDAGVDAATSMDGGTGAGPDGGCGCRAAPTAPTGAWAGALAVAVLAGRRRRRRG